MEERITRLRNLRRGKKTSLSKRLAKIKQMIADGNASRTKLRFLMTAAYECLHAVTLSCNELNYQVYLTPGYQHGEIKRHPSHEPSNTINNY